jgi:hypothetical protein
MSENIKVRKEDKKLLDLLQAEFTLKTGRKVSQQNLFSRMIKYLQHRKEDFLSKSTNLPLSEEQIKKIRQVQGDWNIKTKEEDIDRLLYGA